MKFQAGEIAIHVGGGDFRPGEEVEITAVGPWAAHEAALPSGTPNRQPSDYIIRSLEDGRPAFTVERSLRKRPQPGIPDKVRAWFDVPRKVGEPA